MQDELPLDANGNGARLRTLVFDQADALMMAHAMLLAANRAMMSQAPQAQARFSFYRRQFQDALPEAAAAFRDTDLCEIALALDDAPTWSIRRSLGWRQEAGIAHLAIGEREWRTREAIDRGTLERIVDLISGLAPMGCVQTQREDEEAATW